MNFRITGLAPEPFAALFTMTAEELAARGAVRRVANTKPGFPCRVSLQDAEIGEEVVLTHFEHHNASTPFRAGHAIYVRAAATEKFAGINRVPPMLRTRILSVRGFDAAGFMVDADLADGRELEAALEKMLERKDVAYLHLHFAKPGCYAARVDRTEAES